MKISNGMKKLALIVGALAFPLITFAQLTNVQNLVVSIGHIVDLIIPIMFALGLLGFFYGLVMYIFGKEGENKDQAKRTMIWGVVALFIMASVWGLVNFIQNALGVQGGNTPSATLLIPH